MRQKNTWLGFAKETREAFVLNLHQTISRRLENQHSIWQERREGFIDDNDAVYAELQRQLAGESHGQPAMQRRTPIDALVQSLPVGWGQDSRGLSQETDMSLDFSQTSVALESSFLDSDRASPEDGCHQAAELGPERAGSPDPSNRLSLSLEDFQAGEARTGGGEDIQQDAEGGPEESA